ncbi:aspartate aminotransferase family protein [Halovivax limisalsi]|uniref:aspartate aminotransferase family protein n=1 Tax=Halovivax limisalsi TaxID=1453760 RepID=UPI001FFD240F|nr:aspartate aminotransferase family protein [Halovivax limisalsi]
MGELPAISELHFAEEPSVSGSVPGPNARALLDRQESIEASTVAYPKSVPFAPAEAAGATVRDVDGNTFLDFFAGMSVLNVGHSNPYVLEGVEDQLGSIAHTLDFPTEPRLDLIEKLNEIAPGDLAGNATAAFGGPTGSDAIEASIKLAKHVTGGDELIAFRGSYHGGSAGALSLTAGRAFKNDVAPLLADVTHLPFPHPTRSPAPGTADEAAAICPVDGPCCEDPRCALALENVRELLEDPYSGISDPAGIWIEPIQATGGIVTPPEGFLPGLKELCERNDIPLILDEIQTGMGRTGEWWASDVYDVTPDIMPVSKSIGGVGLPLSVTVYREDYDTWGPGAHGGTFRGNVPAMVGGLRAIEYIEELDLLPRARRLGGTIQSRLEAIADRTDEIVDVRGAGLMWGAEFDPATEGVSGADRVSEIQQAAFESGVLVWSAGRDGAVLRLMPPLVVTETQLEVGLDIVESAVESAIDG